MTTERVRSADLQVSLGSLKGAAWLLEPGDAASVLTPERLSDEHRLIAQTAREFAEKEVIPAIDRLEQKDWALARQLLRRAGELGLLGVDAPEEYGGVGLDKAAALVVSSHTAGSASFSAAFGASGNLAISPILYFGTPEQKTRYLPGLISGETVGAYALSESGSGSDALGASARATRHADGSFSLSGEKMWITNGGFADVFIVFAKVDGEHFTAFIVERGFPGVSTGHEEHKMGLHGSSTTPLILQDAKVPAANLLGEIGKGHKVAFNVLNFGRYKLGAMCVGGCHGAIADSAKYAATRRQFGKPISEFGAIKHKLGEMTVQTYAIESLLYRTAGLIDAAIAQNGGQDAVLAAMEEFAIEASIAKVAGSEALNFVLDENVQIHGGNGFVKDYPAERHYRDARVNRIFEGTNEINRLLIPGMLIRRALKGELPVIAAARALQDEVLAGPGSFEARGTNPLDEQKASVQAFKKVALMSLGLAMQRYGEELTEQQEVLIGISDIMTATACAESALLRASAAEGAHAALHVDAASVFVNDAASRVEASAKNVLAAMAEGDTLRTHLAALRRLLKVTPIDTVSRRRRIADETVRRGSYIFQ
ncbi:MAG TPA: acyl-CoA dehydrogenase family protein [Vicinamibacterales bacterium]|nr:acyl-CoA dehydrogenase family protein [Vicinamibacterales bacterium]